MMFFAGVANIAVLTQGIQFQRIKGGNPSGLVSGTDYSIATDTATGSPKITYLDASAANLNYSLPMLVVSECYRRLYPVIRDSSDIVSAYTSTALSGYTGWNIENYNNALNHNYNGTTEF